MAITAVAAFAGAAVATTATAAVITYVAIAAAVVTVVGVATKNETLTKIGAGLGLGTAVGGWIASANVGTTAVANGGAVESSLAADAAAGTAAGTAAGETAVASNATGMAANSTGTSLRAAEGEAGIGYGGQTATDTSIASSASSAADKAAKTGIIDAAGETSTVAQPAGVAQVADVAGVAQPGMSVNSTGSTLRAMEGANGVPYGSSANGGSSYWDSIGEFWKGLDSGDKQIVGGIVKGVGQGAASYIGERQKTQSQIDAENRLIERRSNFTPVTWRTK